MKNRFTLSLLLVFSFTLCTAQDFSGLLNKRLNKIDDLGSLLETGIDALFGGRLDGRIDSVIVTHDAEKILKVKIYFNGYTNGYFSVSAINEARQKQKEIVIAKFSQAAASSPVECQLSLANFVSKGSTLESAYLRIDVSKRQNGSGNVSAFVLSKKWKNELDPENVMVSVTLNPVGKAATLTNQRIDKVPEKTIKFDPNLIYSVPVKTVVPRTGIPGRSGGNSVHTRFNYSNYTEAPYGDISGTWMNTDANTNGITKLIVTGNNSIQGFGRCSPADCDWGKTSLSLISNNTFRATFKWSFKKTILNLSYDGSQLTVNQSDAYTSGAASRTYTYKFRKNITQLYPVLNIKTLQEVAIANPGTIVGQPVDKSPKGPDKAEVFSIIDELLIDPKVDFGNMQSISAISLRAYLDKNKASGVVYIIPADYHLKWESKTEPEKGYNFRILYGQGADAGTNAPVRMSATLTTGIDNRDINFAKTLLKASLPGLFTNVKYLPLRENPEFTFQSTLGAQYNIPQDKVSVLTSTDLNNDIQVAWQTDADTKEFMETSLTSREGIAASVILKPADEEILDQQIPAIINLADYRTLGRVYLEPGTWRSRAWRNSFPYPVQLKYLHIMRKVLNGSKPIIYSWSMNDAVIHPLAQASFNSAIIPSWLDSDTEPVVMWLDYSVMDCSLCDQKVMDAVTGGVSGGKAQVLKFTVPPAVFDSLNVSYFIVTVRSVQVDPKGVQLKELESFKITKEENKEFTTGPLFLASGGTLDFEYKITAATHDGDFYPANEWIKGSEKEMLLGKTKLKEIFRGILPGID